MSFFGSTDFLIEVQKGNVPGHSLVHKFGRNDGVPSGSWEFINQLGFTVWPLAAVTTVRIKAGGSAADDAGGNGAQEVTVEGIDSTLARITEAITTAGASASSVTTATFWRIDRAFVSAVGTYGAANTADIVIENGAGGTDLIQITIEEGQSQFGGFSIPTGKTGYMLSMHAQVDSNKTTNIRMFIRENLNDTSAPMSAKRIMAHFDGVEGPEDLKPRSPLEPFPALTDIWFEAWGDGAVSEVSIDFEILLVDD